MQEFPAALLLQLLQQLTAVTRRALRGRNAPAELTEEAGAQDGVLRVGLRAHVDRAGCLAGLLLSGSLILRHLVIHALFMGDDQIEQVPAVWAPFWLGLGPLISAHPMQNACFLRRSLCI